MTYDYKTTNESFIKMYQKLKELGIKNNKFHLILYDDTLLGVDPYDPNLTLEQQARIYKECVANFWYFIRTVVRVPTPGGPVQYILHRGNLATHFCQLLNINSIECLPRQHFKTYSAVCFYCWIYLYVAQNYNIIFSNKQLDDSQLNIKRLTDLMDGLPDYLKSHLDESKDTSNINMIRIDASNCVIKALSTGRDRASADKLGRGLTVPMAWLIM